MKILFNLNWLLNSCKLTLEIFVSKTKVNYAAAETNSSTRMIPIVEEKKIIDEYGGLLKKHNLV